MDENLPRFTVPGIWRHKDGGLYMAFARCFQLGDDRGGQTIDLETLAMNVNETDQYAKLMLRGDGAVVFQPVNGNYMLGSWIAYMAVRSNRWFLRPEEEWLEQVGKTYRFTRITPEHDFF